MIPRWEINGWISSGGNHCCDQCAVFPLFPGRGSGYICVGLSLCDVTGFFLFHLFLSYHNSPQLVYWHYYEVIGHKSLRWLPLLFHHHFLLFCLWLLQPYACLTALSSIKISFTEVDNLTKHCFLSSVVLIPRFERHCLRLSRHCLLCWARTSCMKSGEVTPNWFKNSTVANGLLSQGETGCLWWHAFITEVACSKHGHNPQISLSHDTHTLAALCSPRKWRNTHAQVLHTC